MAYIYIYIWLWTMPWNVLGTLEPCTKQIFSVTWHIKCWQTYQKRKRHKQTCLWKAKLKELNWDLPSTLHQNRGWWRGTPCALFYKAQGFPGNVPSRKFRNLWIETKHGSAEHQSPSKQLKCCSGKRASHANRNYWNELAQQNLNRILQNTALQLRSPGHV